MSARPPMLFDRGPERSPESGIKNISINNETGMAKVEVPVGMLEKVQEALPFYDRAMVGMQQEIDRISQEETRMRSRHPVLSALSAISSNLANQPDMPGFVRGLGAANRELNPDPDRLAMQKLPLYMQVAKLAEDKAQLAMRGEQVKQQGEIGRQNADSLAFSREQAAVSARERAQTQRQTTLDKMADGDRVLTLKQVLAVDPKMDLAEAQSWVEQSKARYDSKQLDAESKRQTNAMLGLQRQSMVDVNKARAEHEREKAKLAPVVGAARAKLYEAHAANLIAREQIDRHEAAVLTEKLRLDIEKFNSSEQFRTISLLNEIEANVMMPEAEKEALRARVKNIAPERGPQSPANSSRVRVPEAPKGGAPPAAAPAPASFADLSVAQIPGAKVEQDRKGNWWVRMPQDGRMVVVRPATSREIPR